MFRTNEYSMFGIFFRPGGIPARSDKGERLLLFVGIIDILQSYRLKKRLEHTFKSIIHDGVSTNVTNSNFNLIMCFQFDNNVEFLRITHSIIFTRAQDTVSVCRPSFYAQRFQNFMAKTVFKKIPSRKFTLVPNS